MCVSPHLGKGTALDVCGLGALLCYPSADQGAGTSHRLGFSHQSTIYYIVFLHQPNSGFFSQK